MCKKISLNNKCSNEKLKKTIGGDRAIKQGTSATSVAECLLSLFRKC